MIDLDYLSRRAAVHSRMKKVPHSHLDAMANPTTGSAKNDAWRKYGEARRLQIVEQDATGGGNRFEMNPECPVESYFELAERVRGRNMFFCT